MSTKAIREALELMKEIQGHSSAEIHAAALAEVEAIERAARVVDRADVNVLGFLAQEEIDDACAVMASIAETTPEGPDTGKERST